MNKKTFEVIRSMPAEQNVISRCDETTADIYVTCGRNKPARPQLFVLIDARSGKIIKFQTSFKEVNKRRENKKPT